jgi:hypothetical protein
MSCRDCDDVATGQSWRGVAVGTGHESLKRRVHGDAGRSRQKAKWVAMLI